MTNETIIQYFDQPMKVGCDRKCEKAWGINNRPRVQLSDYEDDYEFMADGELGIAPLNPGTYEGDVPKPKSPDEFPTKWCVRECERCCSSDVGELMLPLKEKSFESRVRNIE